MNIYFYENTITIHTTLFTITNIIQKYSKTHNQRTATIDKYTST